MAAAASSASAEVARAHRHVGPSRRRPFAPAERSRSVPSRSPAGYGCRSRWRSSISACRSSSSGPCTATRCRSSSRCCRCSRSSSCCCSSTRPSPSGASSHADVSLLTFVSILAVFAIGGGAVAYWVAQHHPDWFLEFPRNRPDTYWTIMLLYPLMSVPPQELVYRTFFFHRYGALLRALGGWQSRSTLRCSASGTSSSAPSLPWWGRWQRACCLRSATR